MSKSLRISVLGANGVLGAALTSTIGAKGRLEIDPISSDHVRAMIRNNSVGEWLSKRQTDWVVNCIAMMGVANCETQVVEALTVNSLFPKQLAIASGLSGVRLLHFSTEMVFNSPNVLPSDSDTPNPVTMYGLSKHLGEPSESKQAITVRLPLLVSRKRNRQLVWRLMTSLEQGTDTFVSLDELTTPVYVEDVAQFIYGMLLDGDTLERCGVLHLSSEKALSLFDIVEKQAVNLGVSTRKLYGRLASELSVSSKKPLVHGLRPSSGCLLPF